MSNLDILFRSTEDFKWLNSNYSKLEKTYSGKFVAIKNKEILVSAKLFMTLMKKLKTKMIDSDDLLIKKIVPKGEILIYHEN